MGRVLLCVLLFMVAACVSPSRRVDAGPPRPELVWSTYAVQGDSLQELGRAMRRRGPRVGLFSRRPAITEWSLQWRYDLASVDGGCRAANFETVLAIDVLMPEWVDRTSAPASLISRWDRFETALRAHETGHVSVAKEAAADLKRRVAALPAASNCSAAAREVERVAQTIVRAARQGEARYDQRTDHGRTQGAVL